MSASEEPASGPRRYAKGEKRRAAIIETAERLFSERGYRAVSLREIAAASGTTHSTLIHYFGSKEVLLQQVLVRRDAEVAEWVGSVSGDSLRNALLTATRRNLGEPGMIASLSTAAAEATDPQHPAHAHYAERYASSRGHLARALEHTVLPDSISPDAAATLLFAVEDGLQIQWLYSPEHVDIVALTRAFVDLLLKPDPDGNGRAPQPAAPLPPSRVDRV